MTTLRIPARLESLAAVRQFVEDIATRLKMPASDIAEAVQAVDEAVTNVIIHGYSGREGEIEVEATGESGCLIIRLRDTAPLFDPTTVPVPDLSVPLEQRPIGGLGVYLMRELTDEMTYCVAREGCNELTLVKRCE